MINNQEKSFQRSDFASDVELGLSSVPKRISSKYFYDEQGSRLFELITQQEEYYLTRTEKKILESCSNEIYPFISHIKEVVEFGPGDGSKAEIILSHFMTWKSNDLSYNAVDISPSAIEQSLSRLSKFQFVRFNSTIGDYGSFESSTINNQGRLFLFLGSNIGNYEPKQATDLLRRISLFMAKKDLLLIGFDKKKDIPTLTAAYNDKAKITRDFNLNLLSRMNSELGSNFIQSNFSHHGIYNPLLGAMQSFLISEKPQTIYFETLKNSFDFDFGEAIHVESSFKYSDKDIFNLAQNTGFSVTHNFEDEKKMFTDSLWKRKEN
jgi:L-histidine Nalpha-methyltransferase